MKLQKWLIVLAWVPLAWGAGAWAADESAPASPSVAEAHATSPQADHFVKSVAKTTKDVAKKTGLMTKDAAVKVWGVTKGAAKQAYHASKQVAHDVKDAVTK